jgi:anti-anti-sigma factor
MDISNSRFADVAVTAPVGRVDHLSASQFEQGLSPLLEAADTGAIVLDFGGVDYISSVGLRVLMIAAKKMRARQAAIAVASLQPVVQEIFDISRFDQVVDVYPSVREALQALSGPALEAFDRAAAAAAK